MSDISVLRIRPPAGTAALRGPDWHAPALVALDPVEKRRARIWDISSTLHCSIIGTCLTAAELRQLFVKLGDVDARTATDHTLHGRGVRTAGQHDAAGKLLHKALDRRHETAIKRFAKAATPAEIKAQWRLALEQGAISGAYWAVLTHPATDRALVQEVFGDVHMLSHMVGSSSRIDIARLSQLERDLGERNDKLARQEARLQIAARERTELLQRIARQDAELAALKPAAQAAPPAETVDTDGLRRRLDDEKAHAARLAARLREAEAKLLAAERRIVEFAALETALRGELAGFEQELAIAGQDDAGPAVARDLGGRTLLYVGGRPGQVEKLKAITERRGGALLAHDGGIEENAALLPGLISQAEIALFPVDCISHRAAGQVKKLCREAGKPFIPLRTASLASFIAALRNDSLVQPAPLVTPARSEVRGG